MISDINLFKELEAYRKYLMLANFKKSTVKMYCRSLIDFDVKQSCITLQKIIHEKK